MNDTMTMISLYDLGDVLLNGGISEGSLAPEAAYLKDGVLDKSADFWLPTKASEEFATDEFYLPNIDWMLTSDNLDNKTSFDVDLLTSISDDGVSHHQNSALPELLPNSPLSLTSSLASPGESLCPASPLSFTSSLASSSESISSIEFQDDNTEQLCAQPHSVDLLLCDQEVSGVHNVSSDLQPPTMPETLANNLLDCDLRALLQDSVNEFINSELPSVYPEHESVGAESSDSSGLAGQFIMPRAGRKTKVASLDERKQRKRNQNKNAATRYRERKRSEQKLRDAEKDVLVAKNKTLRDKVTQIAREIDYLKELMIEVYRIKGFIS